MWPNSQIGQGPEKDIYLGLCWVKTWAFISLYCRKSRLNNEDELVAILENTTALINETIAPVMLRSRRLDLAQWSFVKEDSWGWQLCVMVKSIRSCEVPLGSVICLVPGGRQLSWLQLHCGNLMSYCMKRSLYNLWPREHSYKLQ